MNPRVKKTVAAVGAAALVTLGGVFAAGTAFAQTPTPAAPTAPSEGRGGGPSLDLSGADWTTRFDAAAEALDLTATELFEQLYSGKTLEEIAEAQGVDLDTVQDAIDATRTQAMKDAIAQAVEDGKITQDQADWMLEGLENGYTMGIGGMGNDMGGPGGRGGPGGHGGPAPDQAPTTDSSGASS